MGAHQLVLNLPGLGQELLFSLLPAVPGGLVLLLLLLQRLLGLLYLTLQLQLLLNQQLFGFLQLAHFLKVN